MPWSADRDPLGVTRNAITRFLNDYGYNVPTGNRCLAQPIPVDTLLNIAQAYGRGYLSGLYTEMKQEIEQISTMSVTSSSSSVESMLDDIQRATEIAGYRKIFLLIDNWDDLPNDVLRRLLPSILNADLLIELQQRNLFLKVFVPTFAAETFNHWQKTCDIDRLDNGFRHRLSLYTYL